MPKGDEKSTLTDIAIQKAPAAAPGKRSYLWDANVDSLGIRITDKGSRSFVFMRRLNGKQFLETLGRYGTKPGEMSLKEARTKAREINERIGEGHNPLAEIRENKAAAKAAPPADAPIAFTVAKAIELYEKRHISKMKPRSQLEARRPLSAILAAKWSTRPLASITKADIRGALDEIVDAGHPVAANRALMNLRAFFNFMVEHDRLDANPCATIKDPGGKETSRDRILSDEEIKLMWPVMKECSYPFGTMGQMLLITSQRRDEVANMRWSEITDLDGENPVWTIPAEKNKGARLHEVPLSPLAVSILKTIPRIAASFPNGRPPVLSDFVFTTDGKHPVSGFSGGKERLDELVTKMLTEAEVEPMPHWTLHDLRRTAASNMARDDIPPHVVSRVLNHSAGKTEGITAIYNRYGYLREKRHALESWAARIERIITPDSKVVGIRA